MDVVDDGEDALDAHPVHTWIATVLMRGQLIRNEIKKETKKKSLSRSFADTLAGWAGWPAALLYAYLVDTYLLTYIQQ